ncbi:MAG: glycosyltransferase family 4 protein [candidate division WOR-3 bacterium]|nr:glycosyltransferase family 4 protein [candidate division WOR-3 bacterium]
MRIGIDCRYLNTTPRGVAHYLINILNQFARQASSQENFYLYSPYSIRYLAPRPNFIMRKGNLPLPGTFWFQTQGRSFINTDKLDTFWAPCDILPLGLSKNIYQVLSVHDLTHIFFPQTMANYNRLIHKMYFEKSLLNAHHIITMSNYTKKALVDFFNIKSEKISVIYEGVDEKFQPYDRNQTTKTLSHYLINRPYLLAVGTLEPKKNYPLLLKAFQSLKIDWDLIIIGKKGWKSNGIFKTIDKLGINQRVKILGYVKIEDLPYFYNGAEIFVFPSLYEGFGLPLLEAMACGTPVVCSNSSSLPEIGKDAVLYFNPYSVDELTNQLTKLINDAKLRQELSQKGIARAQEFSWQKTARQTLEVLKRTDY